MNKPLLVSRPPMPHPQGEVRMTRKRSASEQQEKLGNSEPWEVRDTSMILGWRWFHRRV